MTDERIDPGELRVIAPSLGKRFSGINASMLAVLPEQAKLIPIAATGFHVRGRIPRISFRQFLRHCWRDQWRIWHARRNIDMLVGLILRHVFRFKLILLFTSAAQRRHSWITRFYYHHTDGLIATSSAAASFLDRPAVVVCHGVDTEQFCPPKDRSTAWAERKLAGRFGIGVFGRVRPRKGTEEFVDAMIRVLPKRPDWTAVIIGQTTKEFLPFKRRLSSKIDAAGLGSRVHFTGFLKDPNEIPRWYRALSVVVCPSRVEGFGLPCLEAMASGCTVVATRTGAWPEVISEGRDGYLVPCQDMDALADAIAKVTEDQRRVHEMGKLAREKITSQYRIQDEAEGIQAVYKRLFSERGIKV